MQAVDAATERSEGMNAISKQMAGPPFAAAQYSVNPVNGPAFAVQRNLAAETISQNATRTLAQF
jgi:hypothetical protein